MKTWALGLTVAAIVGLVLLSLPGMQEQFPPPTPAPIPGDQPLPGSQEVPSTVSFIPYWDQERAIASFRRNVDVIDEITLFWYNLLPDGSIAKYQDATIDHSLISFAKSNGVRVLVLIANLPGDPEPESDWDWRRVGRSIGDADARQRHVASIVSLVEELGVDGVDIDYEKLRDHQTQAFTQFIELLAVELHERDKRLAVGVHTQKPGDDDTHGQDLVALGKVVDELVFLSYDQHYEESEPGPVASIRWVADRIEHVIALGVPREVIFLGVPLYGYDWPKGGGAGRGIEYEDVAQLLARHDPAVRFDRSAASPHFEYEDRIVWFENARSAQRKIELAKELGVGGLSFWRLGREDPAVWESLRQ